MKKVLLYSRDPGGTYAILPLIESLKQKYEVVVYGKDFAVKIYKNENINVVDITDNYLLKKELAIDEVLEKEKPQVIITGTSAGDFSERLMWKEAKKFNISSIAILDHWCNYGIRFSKYDLVDVKKYEENKEHSYLPDKICVMDEYAKKCMLKEEIDNKYIAVTGQPHFSWLKQKVSKIRKTEEKLTNKKEIKFLFASEPYEMVYNGKENALNILGYTEKTILFELKETLSFLAEKNNKKIKLLIKLHPKNSIDEFLNYVEKTEYFETELFDEKDIWESIDDIDVVCGMTSMLLIESAICNKEIMSIQIGRKNNTPFILEERNIVTGVLSKEKLIELVQDYINGARLITSMKIEENAVNNIIKEMEAII